MRVFCGAHCPVTRFSDGNYVVRPRRFWFCYSLPCCEMDFVYGTGSAPHKCVSFVGLTARLRASGEARYVVLPRRFWFCYSLAC